MTHMIRSEFSERFTKLESLCWFVFWANGAFIAIMGIRFLV